MKFLLRPLQIIFAWFGYSLIPTSELPRKRARKNTGQVPPKAPPPPLDAAPPKRRKSGNQKVAPPATPPVANPADEEL